MRALDPSEYIGEALQNVFNAIIEGVFGFKDEFKTLLDTLCNKNDHYLLCYDFKSYVEAQAKVIRNINIDTRFITIA